MSRIHEFMAAAKAFMMAVIRPHDRPEIKQALSAIEEKKEAGRDLRETITRMAERIGN